MTDSNTPLNDDDTAWPENSDDQRNGSEAGVKRPDQNSDPDFAREQPQPSTGGEGAAGAGGPGGFGT